MPRCNFYGNFFSAYFFSQVWFGPIYYHLILLLLYRHKIKIYHLQKQLWIPLFQYHFVDIFISILNNLQSMNLIILSNDNLSNFSLFENIIINFYLFLRREHCRVYHAFLSFIWKSSNGDQVVDLPLLPSLLKVLYSLIRLRIFWIPLCAFNDTPFLLLSALVSGKT